MEAATLPEQQEDGAPVEEGAEATRSADHLFQYSKFVHAGVGAAKCEHAEDGKCDDAEHFHAWICLPNSLQHGDITEKARATKARRKLAMRDPQTDAYAILEAELDDLLRGDRTALIPTIADHEVRQRLGELVRLTRDEERFEDYGQHREEWQRLSRLPEDERPAEEWEQADKLVSEFQAAVEERIKAATDTERSALEGMSDEQLRDVVRNSRIEGETEDVSRRTFYTWMGFVGTRRCPGGLSAKRYFPTLEDMRNAPPEAVQAIDDSMDELEMRLARGDAAGN